MLVSVGQEMVTVAGPEDILCVRKLLVSQFGGPALSSDVPSLLQVMFQTSLPPQGEWSPHTLLPFRQFEMAKREVTNGPFPIVHNNLNAE